MAYRNEYAHCVGADQFHLPEDLARQIVLAARKVDVDPDEASLILDGLIWQLLAVRYLAENEELPDRERLLAQLDLNDPALARRVRLALRAPDVHARLAHVQQLCALLIEANAQEERIPAHAEAM